MRRAVGSWMRLPLLVVIQLTIRPQGRKTKKALTFVKASTQFLYIKELHINLRTGFPPSAENYTCGRYIHIAKLGKTILFLLNNQKYFHFQS